VKRLRRTVTRLRRGLKRFVLLVGVPLLIVIAGVYLYAQGGRYVDTENAYVKANIIAVSAHVPGRVVEVWVEDNQRVSAGELLFRVDPRRFEVAVAEANARLQDVRTEIESLRADYREILVREREARERQRFLTRKLERQQQLIARKLGSQEAHDQADHELGMARYRVKAIAEQKRRVLASLAGSPDLPIEEHPRYLLAEAAREQAAINIEDTSVTAPVAGVISNMTLQAGEFAEEGDALFSIIESAPAWIEANLKETQLTHVRPGQPATVVVDAHPDRTWDAMVTTIAPATGAEFALLPPQNATGNWVKVVQRIPVTLELIDEVAASGLRAGMTVTVSIDTGHQRNMRETARQAAERWGLPHFVTTILSESLALVGGPR
jgi:membrane fusion protein (multidrug efflux system)